MRRKTVPQLYCLEDPYSVNAETYRTLRTNIRYSKISRDIKSMVVTSALAGEGKTTTVANLAVVMAQAEQKVLLIDGDLRKPSLHNLFSISNVIGLTNLLMDETHINDVIQPVADLSLDVITAGPTPPMPVELLSSHGMNELLVWGEQHYDIVLLDTPPLLPVTDALELAKRVEGVLLVLRSGKVLRENVEKSKKLLDHVGATLIGTVLNDKKVKKKEMYYYGS